ncbi:hypothetical protein Ccrd_024632 [Cynara cardunculus var. scolymus]|uniref:Uncharacterized protein n=1 Tax=Cynara cardunculus var. scolymus TaxID=59895 RepID=A0A118JS05_CYNCS|nr:hypothetical protein Ccrd_024632 [Cynara cardunculus var. scolymus]
MRLLLFISKIMLILLFTQKIISIFKIFLLLPIQWNSTLLKDLEVKCKAIMHRVIRPDQWFGDLFKPYEIYRQLRHTKNVMLKFNYFDYINAWEHAFYYENRQRKFSWWIQFSGEMRKMDISNWFIFNSLFLLKTNEYDV